MQPLSRKKSSFSETPNNVSQEKNTAFKNAILFKNTQTLKIGAASQKPPELNIKINDSPVILETSKSIFDYIISLMLKNIEENWPELDLEKKHALLKEKLTANEITEWENEITEWNQRRSETIRMLYFAQGISVLLDRYYVHCVGDGAAGILAMTNQNIPRIEILITQIGSMGGGGILTERAVKQSMEWGCKGKVEVEYASEDAKAAYEALGFHRVNKDDDTSKWLQLDPKNSNLWILNAKGEWQLKKYLQMKEYLSSNAT